MIETAAALVIGNEILTGKVPEANIAFLGRELFALGIELRRVIVCRDQGDEIVAGVQELRADYGVVFTSGGVGPTHDDITIASVARALGREVVRHPALETVIRAHFGTQTTGDHLRMADIPVGAELVYGSETPWPAVVVDNVYVFPGVPSIFRRRFQVVRPRLGETRPFASRQLLTRCDEGAIAAGLAETARRYPDLTIGCYLGDPGALFSVKITFDGRDAQRVDSAVAEVRARLPHQDIVEETAD